MTDIPPRDAPEQTDVSAADVTLSNTSNVGNPQPPEPSALADLWSWICGQDSGTYLILGVLTFYILAFGRERWLKPRPIEMSKALRWVAIMLIPIWGLIGYQILQHLWDLTTAAPPTNGGDLRWHILAFLGLVTAFGATLSAPLALVRVATTERQTRTVEQGHITDRISAAVEQLGAEKVVKVPTDKGTTAEESKPNIEVRIGGLLSLERIAQDSTRYDQGRDHVRVMEIICAYVRENAPASGAVDFPLPEWVPLKDNPTEEERQTHEMWTEARFGNIEASNVCQWAQSLKAPPEDIQTALNVLKRRTSDQRKVEANWPDVGPAADGWVFDEATFKRLPDEPAKDAVTKEELNRFKTGLDAWETRIWAYDGYRLDLRNTNLQGADLSKAVFSGALLNDARMEGANLGWARMEGVILFAARVEGADLSRAGMEGADLRLAGMEGADLSRVRMEGVELIGARIEGANLSLARMEGVKLIGARMEGTDLYRARMEGANLDGVRMQGAILDRARIDENTSFQHASFQAARWKDVTLIDGDLTQEQINASFGDSSVTLPEGLEWPAHWPEGALSGGSYNNAYQNWLKTRSP